MKSLKTGKLWEKEEVEYLEERWGNQSIGGIAKRLKRSKHSIINKKNRMKLGTFLETGEYITLNQLIKAVNGEGESYICKLKSWVEERGLKVINKKVKNNTFRIVYLNDFWKWAEQNRSFLDFSKMKRHIIGAEPEWVEKQRKIDIKTNEFKKTTPWTSAEDDQLKLLLKQYKYGYLDITKIIRRTSGAIQKRITDLKIRERPVKAYNHNKYTEEEKNKLKQFILGGYSYELMEIELGRSSKAIRGYIGRIYGSEDLDKARSFITFNCGRK